MHDNRDWIIWLSLLCLWFRYLSQCTMKRFVLTYFLIVHYVTLTIGGTVDVGFYKKMSHVWTLHVLYIGAEESGCYTLLWWKSVFLTKRKAMIWLVIRTAVINVVSLISCCLQHFCCYVVHLRPKKLPQMTCHTLCSYTAHQWFNKSPRCIAEQNFHNESLSWNTVMVYLFFPAQRKIIKQVSIYLYVMGY